MKICLLILASSLILTSCSLIPELSIFGEEIEKEIVTELKVGTDAIQKQNQEKI